MTRIADEQEMDPDEIDAVLTSRLTPAVLRYVERGGKAVCVQRGTGPAHSSCGVLERRDDPLRIPPCPGRGPL